MSILNKLKRALRQDPPKPEINSVTKYTTESIEDVSNYIKQYFFSAISTSNWINKNNELNEKLLAKAVTELRNNLVTLGWNLDAIRLNKEFKKELTMTITNDTFGNVVIIDTDKLLDLSSSLENIYRVNSQNNPNNGVLEKHEISSDYLDKITDYLNDSVLEFTRPDSYDDLNEKCRVLIELVREKFKIFSSDFKLTPLRFYEVKSKYGPTVIFNLNQIITPEVDASLCFDFEGNIYITSKDLITDLQHRIEITCFIGMNYSKIDSHEIIQKVEKQITAFRNNHLRYLTVVDADRLPEYVYHLIPYNRFVGVRLSTKFILTGETEDCGEFGFISMADSESSEMFRNQRELVESCFFDLTNLVDSFDSPDVYSEEIIRERLNELLESEKFKRLDFVHIHHIPNITKITSYGFRINIVFKRLIERRHNDLTRGLDISEEKYTGQSMSNVIINSLNRLIAYHESPMTKISISDILNKLTTSPVYKAYLKDDKAISSYRFEEYRVRLNIELKSFSPNQPDKGPFPYLSSFETLPEDTLKMNQHISNEDQIKNYFNFSKLIHDCLSSLPENTTGTEIISTIKLTALETKYKWFDATSNPWMDSYRVNGKVGELYVSVNPLKLINGDTNDAFKIRTDDIKLPADVIDDIDETLLALKTEITNNVIGTSNESRATLVKETLKIFSETDLHYKVRGYFELHEAPKSICVALSDKHNLKINLIYYFNLIPSIDESWRFTLNNIEAEADDYINTAVDRFKASVELLFSDKCVNLSGLRELIHETKMTWASMGAPDLVIEEPIYVLSGKIGTLSINLLGVFSHNLNIDGYFNFEQSDVTPAIRTVANQEQAVLNNMEKVYQQLEDKKETVCTMEQPKPQQPIPEQRETIMVNKRTDGLYYVEVVKSFNSREEAFDFTANVLNAIQETDE